VSDRTDDSRPNEALTDCEEKIEELQEENAQLRYAAETFGELAERLNAERRHGGDRRQGDRRVRAEHVRGEQR
jgi:hypothetical protein